MPFLGMREAILLLSTMFFASATTRPVHTESSSIQNCQNSKAIVKRRSRYYIPRLLFVVPPHKKTLVIDLDETLVHSVSHWVPAYNFSLPVTIGDITTIFYVVARPHMEQFLSRVSRWYSVSIWTASLQAYADPLIDKIDINRVVSKRWFRESCTVQGAEHIKDLTSIGSDLSQTVLLDNNPAAFGCQDNGVPIVDWIGDNPDDDALLNLIPFLEALHVVTDVRSVLSVRNRDFN